MVTPLTERRLASPDDVVRVNGVEYVVGYQRTDLNVRMITATEMSPEAAKAVTEVARYTHAVPAEEQTKRSVEVTKRRVVVALCFVVGVVTMFLDPKLGAYICTALSVFGGVTMAPEIIAEIKKKAPELPPRS